MQLFNKNKPFNIKSIEFHSNKQTTFSKGLKQYIDHEISIERGKLSPKDLTPILEYLVDFIIDDRPYLQHGQKISCFTWNLRLNQKGGYFHLYEFYPKKKAFISGVSITLKVMKEQLTVCQQLKTLPQFPLFDQIVEIDPKVRSKRPAHLFRWKREDPHSGWISITGEFDGDPASFESITLGEFMVLRPEARQFMGLPFGYKVIWDGKDAKIAFDPKMLEES